MPVVSAEASLAAQPQRAYEFLTDMESFPRFMDSVERVTVLERWEGGSRSDWTVRIKGGRFRWVEVDRFDPAGPRIEFQQVQGDLRRFQGDWQVIPRGGGATVRLTVDFEFGLPMLAPLLNPVAALAIRSNCASMVEGIEKALGA